MSLLPVLVLLAAMAGPSEKTVIQPTAGDRPFAMDSLLVAKQKRISPDMLRDIGFVRYTALLMRSLDGDTTVDYSRMRFWFTQTRKYDPFCLSQGNQVCEFRDSMHLAYTAKNWNAVRQYATRILQRELCDIEAQSLASTANLQLGDSTLGQLQGWTSRKLLESIRSSGDGKSPETAYKLISDLEERPLLAYLGYTKREVETVEEAGRVFDKVKAVHNESKKTVDLWFDLTLPYIHLEQLPDSVKAARTRGQKK
ncbi:MAG: DUF4919 domain-containing protein [bacterium]|nr:DUF4919 domain-containing protein [bacterium]